LSGIAAVEFAAAGMTGPDTVLDGQRGVGPSFARQADAAERLDAVMADLGEAWRIREVAAKVYPTCHFIQPYIECLERLLLGVSRDAVAAVTCFVAADAARLICEPWPDKIEPATPYQAKWSLPYCLGSILAHGRIGPDTFDRVSIDPRIIRFARLVDWKPMRSDFPRHYPGRVELSLKDGRRLDAAVADVLGSPERPLGRDATLRKFRTLTERALIAGGSDRLIAAVAELDGAMTARQFGEELRAVTRRRPPPHEECSGLATPAHDTRPAR
jgi:2-methylcitrate dehydratase PrpD